MANWLNSSVWTEGTAQIVRKGALDVDSRGKPQIEDIYGLLLAPGTRPAAGQNNIPAYGADFPDTVEGYSGLIVKGVKFSQPDPHSRVWEARVTYALPDKNDSDDEEEDPEGDDPPPIESSGWKRIRLGYQQNQREFSEDVEGTAVLNSAGDPFENAPTIDTPLTQLTLVGRTRREPLADCVALNNTINSSAETVLGVSIDAKKGLLSIDAECDFDAEDPIWTITATITINPAGWDMKVLQNGYRYKDANGNVVKFTETTEDGRLVECTTPMLLTAEGGDGRGGEPAYATFKPYAEASWSRLSLPSSVPE